MITGVIMTAVKFHSQLELIPIAVPLVQFKGEDLGNINPRNAVDAHAEDQHVEEKESNGRGRTSMAVGVADPRQECTVRPGKANTEEVAKGIKITDVLVWTAFMQEHRYGKFHWPVSTCINEMEWI